MKNTFIIEDLEKLKRLMLDLPRLAGHEAVTFFKSRIDKQTDVNGTPFAKRKFTTQKQAPKLILKDRHNLYDAIKILNIAPSEVTVGINENEVPYAEAHNEGAEIQISDRMRKFFWAMHNKLKGNPDANFWKGMALKKGTLKIPKRQFIGDSAELEKKLEEMLYQEFEAFERKIT